MFSDKEWTKKDGNKIVFKNFCSLIVNLTEEQQQLILDLTDRYTWITHSEYQSKLIKVLNKVENDKLEKLKKIYFFPIMRPEDEGKTKSGHTILYMVKAIRPILEKYRHIEFEYVEQYSIITDSGFQLKDTESVFLLDDYLGSGETISATVKEIYKNRNTQPKHLNVISIASQFASIEFLEKINLKYQP